MAAKRILVDRKIERKQFTKPLGGPRGQTILVGSQAGTGRIPLINQIAKVAEQVFSPKISCLGQLRH